MTAPTKSQPETPAGAAAMPARSGLLLDLAVPVMLALVTSAVVGFIVEKRLTARFATEKPDRPPVAVVDDIGLIRLAIENGANRYNPKEVAAEVERMVIDAGLEDTVLISQSMVLYSPPDARIEVAAPKPAAAAKPVLGGRP